MKVRDLIEKLQTFDPERDVLKWGEEDNIAFDIFEVHALDGRVVIH